LEGWCSLVPVYVQNFELWQIEEYLRNGSNSGARNRTLFHIALLCCWQDVLKKYANRLIARDVADGHTETEARKILRSAWKRFQQNGGCRFSASGGSAPSASPSGITSPVSPPAGPSGITLPVPIADGFITFLETAFSPNEFVALSEAVWNGKDKFEPRKGETRKRDQWINDCRNGTLPKSFLNGNGCFVRINPMRENGSSDADVMKLRFCLIEFDEIPLEVQFELLLKSNLPIRTLTFSGDRSLHALVRINAATRAEYEQRRDRVLKLLADYQVCLGNKSPSHYSRMPGLDRILFDKYPTKIKMTSRQELLAIRLGATDWEEWVGGARSSSATGTGPAGPSSPPSPVQGTQGGTQPPPKTYIEFLTPLRITFHLLESS
jgi:hypothetical protein